MSSQSHHHPIIQLLRSRKTTVVLAVLIILLGFGLYRNLEQQQGVKDEIVRMEQEIEVLHERRVELARLIDILESTNYIEQEARVRLGLKKLGEKVVSVPENARPTPQTLGGNNTKEQSNAKQWFEYFFKNKIVKDSE